VEQVVRHHLLELLLVDLELTQQSGLSHQQVVVAVVKTVVQQESLEDQVVEVELHVLLEEQEIHLLSVLLKEILVVLQVQDTQ
tara:strand:- start:486 stop:734 length:249 start_codon:yes stop_codon:yes gene_type:complete